MTSLHALITALVRLLGLFYAVRAFDQTFSSLFWMFSVQQTASSEFPISQHPLFLSLSTIIIYGGICVGLFFLAPKLSNLMIGAGRKSEELMVPWHETLVLTTGILISGWAFVRVTETTYTILQNATTNGGVYQTDLPMLVFLFMTAILLASGILLIAKFHRISQWMEARREGKHVS